jgi:RND family efflux transporter MFP subunit
MSYFSSSRFWLILALMAGFILLAGYGLSYQSALLSGDSAAEQSGHGRSGKGVPVIVTPVAMGSDTVSLKVVGTGRAQQSVLLRSEGSGPIVRLALAANRHFAKDDLLMQLNDEEQRLALQLAQTRLEDIVRTRARIANLQDKGVAAQARLDEVETQTQLAELEVDRARKALADRSLLAPFDGVSSLPEVEKGAYIESGDTLAGFDDRSQILVEFDVPESLLPRLEKGMSVTATTPSVKGRSFEGQISAINSRLDSQSRTARVRVAIPNRNDLLRPGSSYTIELSLPGESYPIVPELALQFSQDGLYVWRIQDEKAERVPVRLVRRQASQVLLDGDLKQGDSIVLEGTQRLQEGRLVRITGSREDPSS